MGRDVPRWRVGAAIPAGRPAESDGGNSGAERDEPGVRRSRSRSAVRNKFPARARRAGAGGVSVGRLRIPSAWPRRPGPDVLSVHPLIRRLFMAPRPTELTGELFDYVLAHIGSDDVQDALIAETQALGDSAGLQISPDEGAFLTMITRLTGVRNALEIGTF